MIELGQEVRDIITGFTGIATGRCEYITGCSQVLVAPPMDASGSVPSASWFDLQRVVAVPGGRSVTLDNGVTPGADLPAPVR